MNTIILPMKYRFNIVDLHSLANHKSPITIHNHSITAPNSKTGLRYYVTANLATGKFECIVILQDLLKELVAAPLSFKVDCKE